MCGELSQLTLVDLHRGFRPMPRQLRERERRQRSQLAPTYRRHPCHLPSRAWKLARFAPEPGVGHPRPLNLKEFLLF
jgi:hypothetical protein